MLKCTRNIPLLLSGKWSEISSHDKPSFNYSRSSSSSGENREFLTGLLIARSSIDNRSKSLLLLLPEALLAVPYLCDVPLRSGNNFEEGVRQYTTFDSIIFSVKYPWMGISSLSCILLDEVALIAWYDTVRE